MSILIIGGGICGLGTALLLARDDHDLTVLECDVDEIPDSLQDAWESWTREYIGTITPVQDILRRPAVVQAVAAATEGMKHAPPMRMPGPDRSELLDLTR